MRTQPLTAGAVLGLAVGLIISILMTFLDWRTNPSGLFHNQNGTNWSIVAETAISWFWPVALGVFVISAVARYWMLQKDASKNT